MYVSCSAPHVNVREICLLGETVIKKIVHTPYIVVAFDLLVCVELIKLKTFQFCAD